MPGILEGITVADLSRVIAVPRAAMALADPGARVIKVEVLAGEDGRHLGPPIHREFSVSEEGDDPIRVFLPLVDVSPTLSFPAAVDPVPGSFGRRHAPP